jgi:uncharacterized membrane protein
MYKKVFLFITTILAVCSISNGYGPIDSLKGDVNATTFLDWFNNTEKFVHIRGIIVLDLIPIVFLIIQAFLFFKDKEKAKGLFTVLAVMANLIGVFFVIQFAYPIASQISSWTPDSLPSDWIQIKEDWINAVGLYGLSGILGWLCFLITYFVPKRINTGVKKLPRFLNFIKNALLFILTFTLSMGVVGLYEYCFLHYEQAISGVTFIEMHNPLDKIIRQAGPIVFTIIVAMHLILAALFFFEKSKQKVWLIILSILFLLCDTYIALQYNGPLNDLFQTWTPATIPSDWASIRAKWMDYHLYRNIFKVLGIACILHIYFVGQKRRDPKRVAI